jgi:hypothetical protein
MADFGAFQAQTPQDVLASLAAQRSKVMVGGNVQQQRSQNIESALDGLFGNPQVRQAARLQQQLKQAQQGVQQKDGEDQLDYELRRLQGMRDAVADVSPETASQINQKMLEIGEQKFQRSRLMAHDDREKQEFNLDIDAKKDAAKQRALLGGGVYVLNTKDGTAEQYDINDPESAAKFDKDKGQPDHIVISPEQQFQLYHDKTLQAMKVREALARAGGTNDLSKVTAKEVEKASAGLLDTYATAGRLFQVLETNPDVMSKASAGAKAFDKVATELAAAGRMASGGKTSNGQKIDDFLTSNNITNERAQSLTIALAAAMAKANNPDGRISDNDMRIAVNMVGGNNPNPAVVLSNLNDTLTRSTQSLFDRIDYGPEGMADMFKTRRQILGQRAGEFKSRFETYAKGRLGQNSTGIAPEPDADGWTTVNGVRIREKK